MKTMRMNTLIPLILVLVAGALLLVPDARAEVRVNAIWRTPDFSLQTGNSPRDHFDVGHRRAPLVIRHHVQQIRLLPRDRQIARRLSRYTGVPKRELLSYRSHGYTWMQIGHWLGLPRPAIRSAMRSDSWQRHQSRQRGHSGCLMDYGPGYRGERDRGKMLKRGGGRHGR